MEKVFRVAVGVLLQRPPIFDFKVPEYDQMYYKYRAIEEMKMPKMRRLDIYNEKHLTPEQITLRKKKRMYDYENMPIVSKTLEGDSIYDIVNSKHKTSSWREMPIESFNDLSSAKNQSNNLKYLHREPRKTLHLLVKDQNSAEWDLPWAYLKRSELLHTGAERFLKEIIDFNTYETCVIGKVPILFFLRESLTKVFVMKSRFVSDPIFPGSPNVVDGNRCTDYVLLTRDEVPTFVSPEKFNQLKNLLALV